MSKAPLLSIEDLTLSYRPQRSWLAARKPEVRALAGVNLHMEKGKIHGLAGESGSGKSSLARCLVGLESPDSGKVLLNDQDIINGDEAVKKLARQSIQLIFQDPGNSLSPRRTIAQIISEPARHFGLDSNEEAVKRSLEAVGLEASAMGRRPGDFSSGQRQRIAIARALICKPDIMVADESLSSLDVSVQAQILDLMHELCQEQGLSILLISHDLAVLKENADQLSVMYRGRIVEQGSGKAIFGAPSHPYTQQLLAALPRLDPDSPVIAGQELTTLSQRGDVPGCVFHMNCPVAMAQCSSSIPGTHSVSGDNKHLVECHLLNPAPAEIRERKGNTS